MLLMLLAEFSLRFFFGFCDTVLLREDPNYEYIAKANQNRKRFGNTILYNSFSMRSEEVDSNAIHILGLGDSVLNGGVLTDHNELASTIISQKLTDTLKTKVQFLNISAGSWGPDNVAAYLKERGLFNANYIYLIVSSHDAYDNMDFKPIVGENKSFPSHQYNSAIVELVDRYLLPRLDKILEKHSKEPIGYSGIVKDGKIFNSGFIRLKEVAEDNNIALKIILHPDLSEVIRGSYNQQGQEITRFSEANNVPIIKLIDTNYQQDFYRDGIHLNEKGQKHLSEIIVKDYLN